MEESFNLLEASLLQVSMLWRRSFAQQLLVSSQATLVCVCVCVCVCHLTPCLSLRTGHAGGDERKERESSEGEGEADSGPTANR